MAIELIPLISSFDASEDFENSIAFYRTKVPWIAPYAYLHIVYKPAPTDVVTNYSEALNIPNPVVEFLKLQNGARLFSDSLFVFGVTRPEQLLNRGNPFSLLPLDIYKISSELVEYDKERFLAIGQYGFDASRVCIDRLDGSIKVFSRKSTTPIHSWSDLGQWIRTEIARITLLFASSGHLLFENSATLPSYKRQIN